ncbi:Sec-independent protein translocase protein TatB [Luteimonas sp. BDR2-5]|uniref:Sec-independent protein translocase protein TatB n=1 Tax=Proluteimonas luteida TaxID=2878685 RepID=UPI001E3F5244|nr:Sec-independent protein translocase protein TatB [Luteimonas sp. BDR2-5]MCD9029112.1 Sec-independent protein translocase protein TatB [Luteimonas sp. BDR2-5]
MFGIGTGELLIIAVVALIVLGPERLPKAARFAGLWVRRARAQWYSVKSELERELAAEELKRGMQQAQRSIADVQTQLRDAGAQAQRGLDAAREDGRSLIDDVRRLPGAPAADAPVGENGGEARPRADAAARTAPAPIAGDVTAPPAPAPAADPPPPDQDSGHDGHAR